MARKGAQPPPPEEKRFQVEATAASSAFFFFSFLARPLSLLRHVAHGCAGYLGLSRRRLKPGGAPAAAASCQQEEEDHGGNEARDEGDCEVVVEVRSRGGPQRPRLIEGSGGNGGAHH
ncbi:hypothetical protein ACP70R_003414 [Stipagrostis hirtigluma subsp. patula]